MILGCIREVNTDYKERDFVDEVTLENSQACAEYCASIEGGLFWTFFIKTKSCHVKNSTSPGRGGHSDTVSGNRACGLSNMTMEGTPLVPLKVVVSQEDKDFPPHQCADGKRESFCVVTASPAPWIALDFGLKVRVDRVDISTPSTPRILNQSGIESSKTLRDFEVRVTDSLPSSGSYSSCVLRVSLFVRGRCVQRRSTLGSVRWHCCKLAGVLNHEAIVWTHS